MFKAEKKLLEFIEKHISVIGLAGFFIIGALMRLATRNFVSEDAYNYLLGWYDDIKNAGGFKALSEQVGNYNVLYQTLIALFTYLPIPALFAYKGLSIVFDLLLALLVGYIVYKETVSEKAFDLGAIAFCIVWMSPVVLFNSSLWAQCDSIYAFFTVLSIYLLYKEKNIAAFVFYGIALAFKLQAVFALPFFLLIYFYKKSFSILNFLIAPAVLWISSIPAIIAGRGVFTAFTLYLNQTNEYGCVIMNYPSFVMTMAYDYMQKFYETATPIAFVIAVFALAFLMVSIIKLKPELTFENYILIALTLIFTAVFFLPAMHDRYGYVYEILAIVYMFKNKKAIIPAILLILISTSTYSNFLFHVGIDLRWITAFNFVAYGVYLWFFFNNLKTNKEEA